MYYRDRELRTIDVDGEKWVTRIEANRLIRSGQYATLEKMLRTIGVELRYSDDGEVILRLEDAQDVAEAKRRAAEKSPLRWSRRTILGREYFRIKEAKLANNRKPRTSDEMIAELKRQSILRYKQEVIDFYAHPHSYDNQVKLDKGCLTYEAPVAHKNNLKPIY